MKTTLTFFAFLLVLGLMCAPAHAATGYSLIDGVDGTAVWGWSYTEVDYSDYFDEFITATSVTADLCVNYECGLDSEEDEGGYEAEVFVGPSWAGAGLYQVIGDHWAFYNIYEEWENWVELGGSYAQEEFGSDPYCPYPDSETSYYDHLDDISYDSYSAVFSASLSPSADYSGRYTGEDIDLNYEDCSAWGGGFEAITNDNFFCCTVGWLIDGTEYAVGNPYWDYVRIAQDRADYYQGVLTDGACTAFSGTQKMSISSCSEPLDPYAFEYDHGHSISLAVFPTYISAIRGDAYGAAK